ncbi:MAG: ORF6N domain-containing protein [Patescibacteria group bacterium]
MKKMVVSPINKSDIQSKIYTIRNKQVMLDEDLARLYHVETKALNQTFKRNSDRFPKEFCFQLTKSEYKNLRSQIVTSKNKGGRRYLPYVFTEQGVAMLSAVLKSEIAIKVSIQIMTAFVQMRKYINSHYQLYQKIKDIEKTQIIYGIKTDERFNQIFKAITANNIIPDQKIFFEGEAFDAHKFVSDVIRSAKKEIILIDNFIDDTVLSLFAKRNKDIKVTIYCKKITQELLLDLKKFNLQYSPIEIKEFKLSHDRFLVIDKYKIYHFGASLKDLGRKWFAVSCFDNQVINFLTKLEKSIF